MGIGLFYAEYKIPANEAAVKAKKIREENPSVLDHVIINDPGKKILKPEKLDLDAKRDGFAKKTFTTLKASLNTQLIKTDDNPLLPTKLPTTITEVLSQFEGWKKIIDDPGFHKNIDMNYRHSLKKLVEACQEIKDLLERESGDFEKMQLLREKLRSALAYFEKHQKSIEKNKEAFDGTGMVCSRFLQYLVYQMRTQVDGMTISKEIGKFALEEWVPKNENNVPPTNSDGSPKNSYQQLADEVEAVFQNNPADHWDDNFHYLGWVLKHIGEFFFALIDNKIRGCHKFYNSNVRGNIDMWFGNLVFNGKEGKKPVHLHTHLGAGPMNDPVFVRAQIAWQKYIGMPHIIHTLEFNQKKGERARLKEMRDFAAEHPLVTMMGTTHDGSIAKGKKNFKQIQSVAEFHQKLAKELNNVKSLRNIPDHIKDYIGFAFPNCFTDDEVREVLSETLQTSKKAFEAALGTREFNPDKKQNTRLCAAMTTGFNTLLTLKIQMKLAEHLQEPKFEYQDPAAREIITATVERACKQCADRGPLANATLLAFTKMIANKTGELELSDKQEIIGLLIGRAMFAGPDRKMVKGRREAFIDLFRIIGNNPKEFVKELEVFVGKEGNESPIQFFSPSIVIQEENQAKFWHPEQVTGN